MILVRLDGVQLQVHEEIDAEGMKGAKLVFIDGGANTAWEVVLPGKGVEFLIGTLQGIQSGIMVAKPGQMPKGPGMGKQNGMGGTERGQG